MAVTLHADSVLAASVTRNGIEMPSVDWVMSMPITAQAQLATALEEFAKNTDAAHYRCSHLMGRGEYQLLLADAPNVPQNEWKTAIRWRLKDLLDFSVADATVDVLSIPVDKNAMGQPQSIYAVAARNQVIQERQALFEGAKIPLSVIEIPEMAQRNIAALLEPFERALALLHFDEHGGLLTITYSGELYLARRLDTNLMQLMQANEEQKEILFDRITLELQRTLDHFERQFRHVVLGKLLLGPMGVPANSLLAYLASNLYVPVELLSLERAFDLAKVPQLKQVDAQKRYFLTLGAALRQEEAVA